jgi:hypothetical protein
MDWGSSLTLEREENLKTTKLFIVKTSGNNSYVDVIVLLRVYKYSLSQNNVTTLQTSVF